MEIRKFEEEVMYLFRNYYRGTEKIGEENWFKISIESLYKKKTVQISIVDKLNADREISISFSAKTYSEVFIETLYLLRDYLLKHPYVNVLCGDCKGRGEFEQSAGSHSFFKDCDKCGGTGKA